MSRESMSLRKGAMLGFLTLLVLLSPACSDDDNTVTASFSQYSGIFTNGTENGTLDLVIASPVLNPTSRVLGGSGNVSGTLTVGTTSVGVTGDLSGSTLTVTGGGYSFSGTLFNGGADINGSYTGPGAAGVLLLGGESALEPLIIYCGNYSGDDVGVWSLLRKNNDSLLGAWYSPSFAEGGAISGSVVNGTSVNLTFSSAEGGGIATGTIGDEAMSGTWNGTGAGNSGDSGSWNSSPNSCPGGIGNL